MNALQKIFFWSCIVVFSGCGGFTEDWFHGSCDADALPGMAPPDPYDLACLMQSGSMHEDSANGLVVMELEKVGECLPDGGSEKWGPDFRFADTVRATYSFRGDTLALSFYSEAEMANVTILLVDGRAGSLEGKWRFTSCAYIDDRLDCIDDGRERFLRFIEDWVEYRVGTAK